jgi:hypothetical protein
MQKIGVSLLAIVMITAGCGQSKKVADPFLSPPKPNNLTAKQTIYNTPAKMKAIEWTPYDIAITAVAAAAVVGGGYLWYQNYKQGQHIEDLDAGFRSFKEQEAKDIADLDKRTSTSFAYVAKERTKQNKKIEGKLDKTDAAKTYAFKPALAEEEEIEETEVVEGKEVVKKRKIWKDRIVEIPEFVEQTTYTFAEQKDKFVAKEDIKTLPFIPSSAADKFAPALHTHAQYQKKKKAKEQFVAKEEILTLPFISIKDAPKFALKSKTPQTLTFSEVSQDQFQLQLSTSPENIEVKLPNDLTEPIELNIKTRPPKAGGSSTSYSSEEDTKEKVQPEQKAAQSGAQQNLESSDEEEPAEANPHPPFRAWDEDRRRLDVRKSRTVIKQKENKQLTPQVFSVVETNVESRFSKDFILKPVPAFKTQLTQPLSVEIRESIPKQPAAEIPAETQHVEAPTEEGAKGPGVETEPIVENTDQS